MFSLCLTSNINGRSHPAVVGAHDNKVCFMFIGPTHDLVRSLTFHYRMLDALLGRSIGNSWSWSFALSVRAVYVPQS